MKKIKLPPLSEFKSRNREYSPYDYLYRWAIRKALPNAGVILGDNFYGLTDKLAPNVSAVQIHEKDRRVLEKQVRSWMKRYKLTRSLDQAVNMYDFQYGPAGTYGDEEPGYAYINTATLIVSRK